MLYRKIESAIKRNLENPDSKVLVVSGARQIGKSYIVRHTASRLFKNLIEINLIEDFEGPRIFQNVRTTDDFYLSLSSIAGDRMGNNKDTLVFLDEIQKYPHLLTLIKFLKAENRFRYAISGSLLGVTLKATTSIPLGSIEIHQMYPIDFEEFLIANGFGIEAINSLRCHFNERKSLSSSMHEKLLSLFKRYLFVGGMPDAVNTYLETHNIMEIRKVQDNIHTLYGIDASKYDEENRLKIKRIYDLVPSNMEKKKKRLVFNEIEHKKGKRASDYVEEIDYLVSSGITIEVKAISNPKFPLIETEAKNLLKLYLNDPGILSGILYQNNIKPVLDDIPSINLGSLYECAVACELASLGKRLFYHDNKSKGEVDFLIDDFQNLDVLPIEVKSGKDYKRHAALDRFVNIPDYNIKEGIVLSNDGKIESVGKILYLPIYFCMFLNGSGNPESLFI